MHKQNVALPRHVPLANSNYGEDVGFAIVCLAEACAAETMGNMWSWETEEAWSPGHSGDGASRRLPAHSRRSIQASIDLLKKAMAEETISESKCASAIDILQREIEFSERQQQLSHVNREILGFASFAHLTLSLNDKEVSEWLYRGYLSPPSDPSDEVRVRRERRPSMVFRADAEDKQRKRHNSFEVIQRMVVSRASTCLEALDSWEFDIFALHEATDGHALTVLGVHLFERFGLFERHDISRRTLVDTFMAFEDAYNDHPYHNKLHAADVTATSSYFMSSAPLANVFTSLDVVACILGAAMHDLGHPGTSNDFLINTNSPLAILYNDRSVLENHHLALGFKILHADGTRLLGSLEVEEQREVRQAIIAMVLATDMSRHLKITGQLERALLTKEASGESFDSASPEDRLLCLKMCLHTADLANPAKPLHIYLNWTERIMEEFCRQGDKERELGMEISPMMNREKPNVERSQIGFIDYVVAPLYKLWVQVIQQESGSPCMHHLTLNRTHWVTALKPPNAT